MGVKSAVLGDTSGNLRQRAAGWLAVLLALPILPLTLSRIGGGAAGTPMPQLAAFAPWALLGWLVVVALLVSARWWRPVFVVGLVLALHVWWVVPPSQARDDPAAGGSAGVPVRVMTINSQYGEADAGAVARAAIEHDIDVLAVQELTPAFAAALDRRLGDRLPHQDLHPVPASAEGTGVFSRWPVRRLGLLRMTFRNPQVVVQVPRAGAVTVTAVHTISPRRGRVDVWNGDLDRVGAAVGAVDGPQIVLGDFNASRDHHGFRELLETGVIDAADAAGVPWTGFTWPSDRRRAPAAVRIDHVLVTPDRFAVQDVDVLDVPGTDHRAVVARLTLAR